MKKNKEVEKRVNRVEIAVQSIVSAMKRNGIALSDMCRAITYLVDENQRRGMLEMHAQGKSIRAIARCFHTNEKRVSALIKAGAPAKKPAKKCKCAGK